MHKRVVILLLTAAVLFSALTVAAVQVSGTETQLNYRVENERGDRSLSHGLTVSQWYTYQSHAYWFADHTFGPESVTDTRFEFHTAYYEPDTGDDGFDRDTVRIETVSDGSRTDYRHLIKANSEYTGLLKAYKELYDATAEGEVTNTYIRYADYCEYYLLDGYFAVTGLAWPFWDSYDVTPVGKATADAFCEYFRIPVLEDDWVRMTIDKRVSSSTMSTIDVSEPQKGTDWYEMGSVGVCLSGTVYFAINAYTNAGNLVDTSLIPGGYGLYACRFGKNGELQPGSLTTVLSLDPRHRPVEMIADTQNGLLLYITELAEERYLSVMDPEAGQLVQQIKILEDSDAWSWYRFAGDLLYCVVSGEKITVLRRDALGQYSQIFETPLAPTDTDTVGKDLYEGAYAFDGERLAVVSALWAEGDSVTWGSNRTCGYILSVYTAEGLAYSAQLTSTLEPTVAGSERSCRTCHTAANWTP